VRRSCEDKDGISFLKGSAYEPDERMARYG
jgi:hypothetical protein